MRSIELKGIFMSKEHLVGNQCQCAECGEFFNRVSTFDKHRKGSYEERRYCLSVQQMLEKGWSLNSAGLWVTAKRPGAV